MWRAVGRSALVLFAIAALVRPRTSGFCPVADGSDTGGGAMGCAFAALGLYFVGQVPVAVGSMIPDRTESPPWLVSGLDGRQRLLALAGLVVSVGGAGVEAIVIPPVTGATYVLEWVLLVAAWGWKAAAYVRPRL